MEQEGFLLLSEKVKVLLNEITQCLINKIKGIQNIRAVPEEADAAKDERCEFMPFLNPEKVFTAEDGKVCAIEFHRTEQDDDGKWIVDHDQVNF